MPELGDQPIEPEYAEAMQEIAKGLDVVFNGDLKGNNRITGFVLLIFPFANPAKGDGRCNYISNGADRKDVVVLMKEMIARLEGQPEMSGKA